MLNIDADNGLSQVYSVGVIVQPRQWPLARSFVMGIAALNPSYELPSINRPNNAVSETRQEAET
jgi:hypothetical protein